MTAKTTIQKDRSMWVCKFARKTWEDMGRHGNEIHCYSKIQFKLLRLYCTDIMCVGVQNSRNMHYKFFETLSVHSSVCYLQTWRKTRLNKRARLAKSNMYDTIKKTYTSRINRIIIIHNEVFHFGNEACAQFCLKMFTVKKLNKVIFGRMRQSESSLN